MPIGNRIFLQRSLPDEYLISEYRKLEASVVADAMLRLCAMHPRIQLYSSPHGPVMCGAALTVKSPAGDNLMLHAALDIAGSGDVIVVSNEGGSSRAVMGEIMAQYAFSYRHVAGIVIDGPVRDVQALKKMNAFLYASGHTPGGPYKNGPGEVNVPIACGGICVVPGDIIVGDADGIVVVPQAEAREILEKAKTLLQAEREKVQKSARGETDRSWVTETLQRTGCEMLDESYH